MRRGDRPRIDRNLREKTAVTDWLETRKAQGAKLIEKTPEEYLQNWFRGIA